MRHVILISGQTGSGKTFLARKIRNKAKRVITLDPLMEYDGIIFYTFDQFADYVKQGGTDEGREFSLTCRFTNDIDIYSLFKLCWIIPNHLLVVEEADVYLDDIDNFKGFEDLIRRGRHQNISLLCNCQRVVDVHPKFRAQVTSFVSFQQVEPIDLKRLETWGIREDEVQALPIHTYIYKRENPEEIEFV